MVLALPLELLSQYLILNFWWLRCIHCGHSSPLLPPPVSLFCITSQELLLLVFFFFVFLQTLRSVSLWYFFFLFNKSTFINIRKNVWKDFFLCFIVVCPYCHRLVSFTSWWKQVHLKEAFWFYASTCLYYLLSLWGDRLSLRLPEPVLFSIPWERKECKTNCEEKSSSDVEHPDHLCPAVRLSAQYRPAPHPRLTVWWTFKLKRKITCFSWVFVAHYI